MPIGTIFGTLWARFNDFQTVQSILKSDFAQNSIYPFILPVATLASGFFQKEPLMWIIVATVWCFAGIVVSAAATMAYRQQQTPQNKLWYQLIYQQDLDGAELSLGNRHQRRSQQPRVLGPNETHPEIKRNILKGQLGIEVVNNAVFPISCFLLSSITKIAGESPPRSEFPKPSILVPPGGRVRFLDDAIDLEKLPCQRLSGQANMVLRYGRKGKERYEIVVKGVADIVMTEFGFVSQVVLEHRDPPPDPPIASPALVRRATPQA